jgi:O-antigen ligase
LNFNQLGLVLLGVALGSLAWSKAGIALLGGSAFLLWLAGPGRDAWVWKLPFRNALLATVAAFLFSAIRHPSVGDPWGELDGLWPVGFLFLTAGLTRQAPRPERFLDVFLVLAGLAGIFSLGQYFGILPPNARWPNHHAGITNIWAFAVAMTTGLPVAVDRLLRAEGRKRILYSIVALACLVGLFGAGEKANIIIGILLASLIPILQGNMEKKGAFLSLGFFAVLVGGFVFGSGRLDVLRSASFLETFNSARVDHWLAAWDGFLLAPWFGHGLGSYPEIAASHPGLGEHMALYVTDMGHIRCHNLVLQLLVTQGVFGLGIVLWCSLSLLLPFIRARAAHNQAFVLGVVAWLIHAGTSATDTPTFQSVRLAAFTLLAGYAFGLLGRKTAPDPLSAPASHPDKTGNS